jgi:hypothetical protein
MKTLLILSLSLFFVSSVYPAKAKSFKMFKVANLSDISPEDSKVFDSLKGDYTVKSGGVDVKVRDGHICPCNNASEFIFTKENIVEYCKILKPTKTLLAGEVNKNMADICYYVCSSKKYTPGKKHDCEIKQEDIFAEAEITCQENK